MLASLRRINDFLVKKQRHIFMNTIQEGYISSPSVSSYDINEQWRLIQHIGVIVGTSDSKKSTLYPMVIRSNRFKDDCRMFDVPRVN
jgi:hypothetical protein